MQSGLFKVVVSLISTCYSNKPKFLAGQPGVSIPNVCKKGNHFGSQYVSTTEKS